MKKAIPWFRKNPQVRHKETAIQDMGDSLRVHGQLQDVAAQADGTLIYGHRRLAGAELIGMKELWVLVYDEPLTATQIRVMQLIENIDRVDLTPAEVWEASDELMKLNGWGLKELAAHLGKDISTASRIMSPSKCIPAVQEAFKAGAIGITDCCAMARVSDAEQHELLRLKFETGANRDEIASTARRKRNGLAPTVQLGRVVISLSSGFSVTVAGTTVSMDDGMDALVQTGKEAKRGRDQNLDVKTWVRVMKDKAAAS